MLSQGFDGAMKIPARPGSVSRLASAAIGGAFVAPS
jgi:hypothetical protein